MKPGLAAGPPHSPGPSLPALHPPAGERGEEDKDSEGLVFRLTTPSSPRQGWVEGWEKAGVMRGLPRRQGDPANSR